MTIILFRMHNMNNALVYIWLATKKITTYWYSNQRFTCG